MAGSQGRSSIQAVLHAWLDDVWLPRLRAGGGRTICCAGDGDGFDRRADDVARCLVLQKIL